MFQLMVCVQGLNFQILDKAQIFIKDLKKLFSDKTSFISIQ